MRTNTYIYLKNGQVITFRSREFSLKHGANTEITSYHAKGMKGKNILLHVNVNEIVAVTYDQATIWDWLFFWR